MRFPLKYSIGLLVLLLPQLAEAATYAVWQGDAVISAATPACQAAAGGQDRISAGTVLRSLLRPAGIADNGNDSRLLFMHDSSAVVGLDLAGGLNLPGTGSFAAYGFATYDGTTSSAPLKTNVGGQYRAFSLVPSNPSAATTYIRLTGTIDGFLFITGCTVTFRAGYVPKQE